MRFQRAAVFLYLSLLLSVGATAGTEDPALCGAHVAQKGRRWGLTAITAATALAINGYVISRFPEAPKPPVVQPAPKEVRPPTLTPAALAAVPAPVQAAAASTFRIAIIHNIPPTKSPLPISWDEHRARLRGAAGQPPGFLESWLKTEGEVAEAQGLPECPKVTNGMGTAFLVGNGDIVVTALHNLDGTIFGELWNNIPATGTMDRWIPRAKTLRGFAPPIVLFNAKNEVVFDSRREGDVATLAAFPMVFQRTNMAQEPAKTVDDVGARAMGNFVAFRLNRKLGNGLKVSADFTQQLDRVNVIAFPAASAPPFVSDGFSQYIGQGPRLPAQEWLRGVTGQQPDAALLQETNDGLLFAELPMIVGMGGAPVLNDRGEVVSMLAGGRGRYAVMMAPPALYRYVHPERIRQIEERLKP